MRPHPEGVVLDPAEAHALLVAALELLAGPSLAVVRRCARSVRDDAPTNAAGVSASRLVGLLRAVEDVLGAEAVATVLGGAVPPP